MHHVRFHGDEDIGKFARWDDFDEFTWIRIHAGRQQCLPWNPHQIIGMCIEKRIEWHIILSRVFVQRRINTSVQFLPKSNR